MQNLFAIHASRLVFALASLFIIAQNAPKTEIAPKTSANKAQPATQGQQADQNAKNPVPAGVQMKSKAPDTHTNNHDDKNETDRKLAEYTKWLAAATAGLVIVGLLQVWLLFRQEKILHGAQEGIQAQVGHINRQANIAERQAALIAAQAEHMHDQTKVLRESVAVAKEGAEFALLNAQAVINAERAWIVVNPISQSRDVYTFLAENVGQTPAKLITSYADISNLTPNERLPELPEYKTLRYDGMIPSLFLPKDRRKIFEIAKSALIAQAYPFGNPPVNAMDFREVHFYGKIVYEDTLNSGRTAESNAAHETKWCFKLFTLPDVATPVQHPYVCPNEYVGYT